MFTKDMARYILFVTFFILTVLLNGGDLSDTPSGTPNGTPSGTPNGTPSGTPNGTPSNTPSGTPSNSPSGNPTSNPPGGHGGNSGSKPKVVISFDSLTTCAVDFFKNQLKPVFDEFTPCVDWHFIPCSTSKIVNDTLTCCSGVMACQINVLHACAAHFYENDEVKLGKFFICMMCDENQYVKGEGCAKAAGMDWKLLNGCQPSKQAGVFCDNRYKQLNKLGEAKNPGVLYNMHYDAAAETVSLGCLKTGICNQIKKQGGSCAACGSSGGSDSGQGGEQGDSGDGEN